MGWCLCVPCLQPEAYVAVCAARQWIAMEMRPGRRKNVKELAQWRHGTRTRKGRRRRHGRRPIAEPADRGTTLGSDGKCGKELVLESGTRGQRMWRDQSNRRAPKQCLGRQCVDGTAIKVRLSLTAKGMCTHDAADVVDAAVPSGMAVSVICMKKLIF